MSRLRGVPTWVLRTLGLAVVAGLTFDRLRALGLAPATDFDDAFMYLRYAEHLLAGHGLVWNVGEPPVFGVTSVLHLAMVTLVRWLAPRLGAASVLQVASGAAAFGFLAATIGIPTSLARQPRWRGNGLLWAAILLPLLAYTDAFVFHAETGMDTMLSALANAMVAFAAVWLSRAPTPKALGLTLVLALVAVLARPDNLLCALLCPTLALLVARPRWRWAGAYLAGISTTIGLLVLAACLRLGTPVPLSFFAKQPHYYGGFAGEFAWNPYLFLKVFGRSVWPFVAAVALFADREGWRRALALLLPALGTMLALARFNQIMGHMGRFDYPFLPYFVAAGTLEFDAWLGRVRTTGGPARATLLRRAVLVALALVAVNLSLSSAAEIYASRAPTAEEELPRSYRVAATRALPELDSWQSGFALAEMAAAAPPGTVFAMSEHGLPGALAPTVTIIDVLGLHDPGFARHGFRAAELFRRAPDVIWMPHPDHVQMVRDMLASDELWRSYAFYPDAFFYGIAVRRDGPNAHDLARTLEDTWARAYPGTAPDDYRAVRISEGPARLPEPSPALPR
jgi:hypothetical protein